MKIKKLIKYSKVLGKRIYRPFKPILNPLLKQIKLKYVLVGLVLIGLLGSFWNAGNRYWAQERAGRWPWSSRAHSQMALAWFEAGNEAKALEELKLGNDLLIIKTRAAEASLKKAEDKVTQPGKVRQEIASWEKILETRPNYRDVYLRLAILNYQVGEIKQAQSDWEKANYLDPNNEEVIKVGKIISSLPYQP